MKFGVREICNVVLRAKAAQKIGNRVFYKNEPVVYFDSLRTSTLEGASTTVYAQGGRGNARLVAWEGERTVTFTMEDALISPEGFSILTGAGLVSASDRSMIVHTTEKTDKIEKVGDDDNVTAVEVTVSQLPYIKTSSEPNFDANSITYAVNDKEDFIYIMALDDHGEVISEPYIGSEVTIKAGTAATNNAKTYTITVYKDETSANGSDTNNARKNNLQALLDAEAVLVDYYVEHKEANAFQVDITPDRFGGNFYLEAETLFRDTNGVDMPAEFIIPNCKIQSNFTFTMASSGDPSTFTFTMDAFPDYTRWNKTKKVFAAIQVIETGEAREGFERLGTVHDNESVKETYDTYQKPYLEEY